MREYDVIVIGGGPAGLAAALSANKNNAKTLIIERESALGGILKQCIHDGFGLLRFKKMLSGPEYAEIFIDELHNEKNIDVSLLSFVTRIIKKDDLFEICYVCKDGMETVKSKTIIFATGCRERTAKQISIHGTRPSGVFTAGTAQHYVNLLGVLPTQKCVILGSGDIGLIMARRLTLEGAKVIGVYEAKSTPSGLTRNIHQCLLDYDISLHLSTTITKVFGNSRLEAVEISKVDSNMRPIPGTEEKIECDALILSVGLIPENELAESMNVKIDNSTKGPKCDAQFMTSVDGLFTCGNATHVNDLVDYVSESGEIAGESAAKYVKKDLKLVDIKTNSKFMYIVPQMLDLNKDNSKTTIYFRSREVLKNSKLKLIVDGNEIFSRKYAHLKPPEMERLQFDFSKINLNENSTIIFEIEEV